MTIYTEKPKEETYVRVHVNSITHMMREFHGIAGKVVSEAALEEGKTVLFVDLIGVEDLRVFNGCDLIRITKKEYFAEALRG